MLCSFWTPSAWVLPKIMKKLYLRLSGRPFAYYAVAFGLLTLPTSGQVILNNNPSRAVGQPRLILSSTSPNLVEGRELYNPQAVAVDTSSNAVYVSDFGNNRILGWKNAS